MIRRICDIEPHSEDRKQELEDVLSRLDNINKVRNFLLHHGSFTTDDKGRITSNVSRAYIAKTVREHRVSIDILKAMISDLEKVQQHLVSFGVLPSSMSFADRAAQLPALSRAWLYQHQPDLPG
jgi:hypothetical protein